MKRIKDNTYVILDNSFEHLRNLGFYCKKQIDFDTYKYRFATHKYKDRTLFECVITVYSNSRKIKIDVYDVDNKTSYCPFYENEFGNYDPIVEEMNQKIFIEFKKLGITKWQKK